MNKPKDWDDKVVFSFRVSVHDYEILKLIAEKEKRSINKQLEIFLSDGLKNYHNKIEEWLNLEPLNE